MFNLLPVISDVNHKFPILSKIKLSGHEKPVSSPPETKYSNSNSSESCLLSLSVIFKIPILLSFLLRLSASNFPVSTKLGFILA